MDSSTLKKTLWGLALGLGFLFLTGDFLLERSHRRFDESFLLGGIQVNEPDHEAWAQSLAEAGMNTVSVTVYAHQGDWNTDHLWLDSGEEGEEKRSAVLSEIRTAKAAGLEVVLILRVALDHAFEANRFLWHGMIQPESPEQVESWFRRYTEFAVSWGRIAQAEGVDLLGVASEMNELTSTRPLEELPPLHEYYLNEEKQAAYRERVLAHQEGIQPRHLRLPHSDDVLSLREYLDARQQTHRRWALQVTAAGESDPLAAMNERRALLEEQWVRLIAQVREVYSGPLTYAANFDQYQDVGFWEHLDVLGVNAYFPLRRRWGPEADPEFPLLLEAAWRRTLAEIAALRRREGLEDKPVVFTELGYTSRTGSTLEPWASGGFSVVDEGRWLGPEIEPRLVIWQESPPAPEERALAVEALRKAAEEVAPGMLRGLLYWKLSTVESHREIEPFVLLLGQQPPDPLLAELQRLPRAGRPGRSDLPSLLWWREAVEVPDARHAPWDEEAQ